MEIINISQKSAVYRKKIQIIELMILQSMYIDFPEWDLSAKIPQNNGHKIIITDLTADSMPI